jgi:hypothetical protein
MGETPHSDDRALHGYLSVMKEQRFLRSLQVAVPRPLAPNSNRTGIQINWVEAMAKIIEIRHHAVEAATKPRFIHLKQTCRQELAAQFASDVLAQMMLALTPERRAT